LFDYSFHILSKHVPWVLGGIVREVIPFSPGNVYINEHLSLKRELITRPRVGRKNLEIGNVNILIHHQIIEKLPKDILKRENCRNRILLTHFDPVNIIPSQLFKHLSDFERILVQNTDVKNQLLNSGAVNSNTKIEVWYGAVDRSVYYPSNLGGKDFVLIVGDCKPRKNPRLVSEVVAKNPDLNFVIHGKGWSNDRTIQETLKLNNLRIIPFSLQSNPVLMRNAGLLLSLSSLEGGPFPVIESLASGTPVVATKTGFCDEIITPDRGHTVSLESGADSISLAIKETLGKFRNKRNVDLLNGQLTWEELAHKIF